MDLYYARCGGSRSSVVKTVCIYRKDQSVSVVWGNNGPLLRESCETHRQYG